MHAHILLRRSGNLPVVGKYVLQLQLVSLLRSARNIEEGDGVWYADNHLPTAHAAAASAAAVGAVRKGMDAAKGPRPSADNMTAVADVVVARMGADANSCTTGSACKWPQPGLPRAHSC